MSDPRMPRPVGQERLRPREAVPEHAFDLRCEREAMRGLDVATMPESELLQTRGW